MNVDTVKAGDTVIISHSNETSYRGRVVEAVHSYLLVRILDDSIPGYEDTYYRRCLKTHIVAIITKEEYPEYYI